MVARTDEILKRSLEPRQAKSFLLVRCIAWNIVPVEQRPRCFSLMDADRKYSNWYVHMYGHYLYIRQVQNSRVFEKTSSFILHTDTFYQGYYTFENVYSIHHYTYFDGAGWLRTLRETYSTAYHDDASFKLLTSGKCVVLKSLGHRGSRDRGNGNLPSCRASTQFGRYQIILLGDRGAWV